MTDKEGAPVYRGIFNASRLLEGGKRRKWFSIGQKGGKYYVLCGSPDRFMLSLTERHERKFALQSIPCKHCYFASEWKSSGPTGRVDEHVWETMLEISGGKDVKDTWPERMLKNLGSNAVLRERTLHVSFFFQNFTRVIYFFSLETKS